MTYRIRTNVPVNLFCTCWEANPHGAGVWLDTSSYPIPVCAAGFCGQRFLSVWINVPLQQTAGDVSPLPHLDRILLKCGEKWSRAPSLLPPDHMEYWHLSVPTEWVPLHGWNSKFWPDYAGNKCCQGLSLSWSGKRKCCSFPEPDTVVQFCRAEIFWWARRGDNQLAGCS